MQLNNSRSWEKGSIVRIYISLRSHGFTDTSRRASIIEHLRHICKVDSASIVLFIYFSYKEQFLPNLSHLYGSLIKQVVEHKRVVSNNLRKHCHDCRIRKVVPTSDQYLEALKSECCNYRQVFLVVYLVEECHSVFKKFLASLQPTSVYSSPRLLHQSIGLADWVPLADG